MLDGITVKKVAENTEFAAYFQVMHHVWLLTQYRKHLQDKEDQKWLTEIEDYHEKTIRENIEIAYKKSELVVKPDKQDIMKFLEGKLNFEKDQIVNLLTEMSLKFTRQQKA